MRCLFMVWKGLGVKLLAPPGRTRSRDSIWISPPESMHTRAKLGGFLLLIFHCFSLYFGYAHTQPRISIYTRQGDRSRLQLHIRRRRDDRNPRSQRLRQVISRTLYHGTSEISDDRLYEPWRRRYIDNIANRSTYCRIISLTTKYPRNPRYKGKWVPQDYT